MSEVMAPDGELNSSAKTLAVLQAALDHSRFTDIACAAGLARSTVHRILHGLADGGYLVIDGSGAYHPGPSALHLAASVVARTDVLAIARPVITSLVAAVGATAHLAMRSGDEAVYLWRADSAKPYHLRSRVGARRDLYSTAIGKVMLAGSTDEEVSSYARRNQLVSYTRRTITDPQRLVDEIRRVRSAGWAIDDEENEVGVVCLAAPVAGLTGVNHAISVSVLALDMPVRDLVSHADQVRSAADAISAKLGAPASPARPEQGHQLVRPADRSRAA